MQCLGKASKAKLGSAIIGLSKVSVEPSRRRGHQDAAISLVAHGVPNRLCAVGGTHDMHLKHEVEIRHIHLGKALVTQDTSVVDQNVHAAKGLFRLGYHFNHLLKFSDATAIGHSFAASGLDFLNDLCRGIRCACTIACAAQIVHHHFCAALGEFKCVGLTQSTACTRYDCNFIFKTDGHTLSP